MVDGTGQLESFQHLIEITDKRFLTEFKTLLSYIEYAANGNSFPDTKFRDVTPENTIVKEYEFKSKHLRIYAIKQINGNIVVLGGLKTNQKADFKRFRSLKEQYLNLL